MKKPLSILLTLTMIFTMFIIHPASAKSSPKISLDEAIKITVSTFNLNTNGYEFTNSYFESSEGRKTWQLNWQPKKGTGNYINASIDGDTGEPINFSIYGPSTNQGSKIPKYSKIDAQKVAESFIKKVIPDKFGNLQLDESTALYPYDLYSDAYNFRYIRKSNNIPFPSNGISISIDKNTLTVKSYNYEWDNVTLPEASNAIKADDAKDIFKNKEGIELSYSLINDTNSKQPKALLVYTLKNGIYPIDAVTGELITSSYLPGYTDKGQLNSAGMDKHILTPEEQEAVNNSNKYITQEEAISIVKKDKHIPFNDNYKLNSCSLYTYNNIENNAVWSLYWNYDNDEKNIHDYISAEVDAKKGELKSFYIGGSDFDPAKDSQIKYDKNSCKKIAEDYLLEVNPDKFKQSEYREYGNVQLADDVKLSQYSFNYIGKYKGVSCPFNTLSVTVDAYTGNIRAYGVNWFTLDLPSSDGALDTQSAYKALFSKYNMTLKYVKFTDYKNGSSTSQIKLVYSLDNFSGMMDAKTGTMLDYNGNPVKDKKVSNFDDIKGTTYERDINILVDMGVIDVDSDKFNPNSKILQKDFIKMLIKSIQPDYYYYNDASSNEYDNYYDLAVQKNIIKQQEINQNGYVTRQDAARMIIKTLGIGFVAELQNIYNSPFKDIKNIPQQYRGYCVLANQLKIITSQNGNFNSSVNISRGSAASFIVNYLKVNINPQYR